MARSGWAFCAALVPLGMGASTIASATARSIRSRIGGALRLLAQVLLESHGLAVPPLRVHRERLRAAAFGDRVEAGLDDREVRAAVLLLERERHEGRRLGGEVHPGLD